MLLVAAALNFVYYICLQSTNRKRKSLLIELAFKSLMCAKGSVAALS